MGIKIQGINHVGLAPKDPIKAKWFFAKVLGFEDVGTETVESQQTKTQVLSTKVPTISYGERLEILEPLEPGRGPIGKFLSNKKSGIHHLALSVSSIDDTIRHLKDHNVRLIDETARSGVHNTKIVFVHPESTGGLLVEFVEEAGQKA